MSRLTFLSLAAYSLFVLSGPVHAAGRGVGLGFILGEPDGVSGKLWLGNATALAAAVGWSNSDRDDSAHLQLDHVWHDFGVLDVDRGSLPVYYGLGVRIDFHKKHDQAGVRFPLGLAYLFKSRRADIFLEVVPALELTPDTDVDVGAGLGARYFFR